MTDEQKQAFLKLKEELLRLMEQGHIEDVGEILGVVCLSVANILDYIVKKESK